MSKVLPARHPKMPGNLHCIKKSGVFLLLVRATAVASALATYGVYADEIEEASERHAYVSGINVMQAFVAAYPEQVKKVIFADGNWALESRGGRFYWARGRLLPEAVLAETDRYSRHSFYSYGDDLPQIREFSETDESALRARITEREHSSIGRHPGLYNAIWRIDSKGTAWGLVKTTFFLGKKVMIHRELLEDLASVEEELLFLMKTDKSLAQYMDSIAYLEGYNWRAIAGTISLSNHSYGIAIDFVPKRTDGKETYWRWARDRFANWFSLPHEQRFMPPRSFIRAFEKRGFIWGGKWFYFDTIHFEYRPEILALNGYQKIVAAQDYGHRIEEVWIPPGQEY